MIKQDARRILDSRWGEEGIEYFLVREGAPVSASGWVPDYALDEPLLKDEFHALFPHRPMPAEYFDDWLFTPTCSGSTFHGFSSAEERTPNSDSPRGSCSGVDTEPSYWWDEQPEEAWRKKWLKGPWPAAPDEVAMEEGTANILGEEPEFEHTYTELPAEVMDVAELYPASTSEELQFPQPAPDGGEGGRGGFEGGMDVRGSGREAQRREETESEGEGFQPDEEEDDNDPRWSMSPSSESEDSQKGAPLVKPRGAQGGSSQEQGNVGGTASGSWRSRPASPPERSEEGGVTSVSGGTEQGAEGGRRSGQDVLPEGAESSTGSSVAVERKVRSNVRAPSSNVEARGSGESSGEEPGAKARRRGQQAGEDSASGESRKEGTQGGRKTLRKRKERKRWSSTSLLNWCRGGTDSEGTSNI